MKNSVYLVNIRYVIPCICIMLGVFGLIYWELKKNQTLINTIMTSIRELRAQINFENKQIQNSQLQNKYLDKNTNSHAISSERSIPKYSPTPNIPKPIPNMNTPMYEEKFTSPINSKDSTCNSSNNNQKKEIYNDTDQVIIKKLEKEINQYENDLLELDNISETTSQGSDSSNINITELATKVNENLENKTYSPKDTLDNNISLDNTSDNDNNTLDDNNNNISNNTLDNNTLDNNTLDNTIIDHLESDNEQDVNISNNLDEKNSELNKESNYDIKSKESDISSESELLNKLKKKKKKNIIQNIYNKYTAKELHDLCRNNNLKVRGNKQHLINRLLSYNILKFNEFNTENNSSISIGNT